MIKLLERFPFTILLALIGFLVGSIIGSGRDILSNYNFGEISSNPVGSLFDYFSDFLTIIVEDVLVGLVLALVIGSIGFIIDFSRRD